MSAQLTAEDKAVLKLIYTGHDVLSNITDYLGVTMPFAQDYVYKLESAAYIKRLGTWGSEYLRFALTEKGLANLELSEKAKTIFEKFGLSEEDVKVLKTAKELGTNNDGAKIAEKVGLTGMQVVVAVENLENKGFAYQTGIVRRFLWVTESGEKMLKEVG